MKKLVLVGSLLVGMLVAAEAKDAAPSEFPNYGILPKRETGALRFLEQHPDYDGRGVVVAIFDTGVDPGAPGLQVTSDGRPKIVDVVDGSGSGDVDTSTVKKAEEGALEGLSGRKLTLGKDWENPSGEFRVGIKRGYELYPGSLVGRVKAERRKEWDEKQRVLLTQEKRALVRFDRKNPKPDKQQKKERDELEERIKQLEGLQRGYDDPGPIYDCVVFHDGEDWRAAIDTDEDGDLGDEKLLTNFRKEREYGTFSDLDLLNFAVNIYDEGDTLSIVVDCGAHGTHVAGIVAANYPDQPELNGIAPGAQIVSVKIGDTRMGSSSMGTGETRGLIAVLQNKCDLINMSYGGPTSEPNEERSAKLYSEIVNKHGVIFVASAGNSGPALSTVGAPGGTTSAIFGIGAYVSPEMMEVQYSLRKKLPELNYTWTSRGPTFDGDIGVNFCAPGGAIAPVPTWTLQGNMLMNGTSMSSPNACGGIALMLSGLKAQSIDYTPYRVRKAIENTARFMEDVEVFAQGHGLMQIDKAFAHLEQFKDVAHLGLRYEVDVPALNGRGIYLREAFELKNAVTEIVRVQPVFHEDADNRKKVDYQVRIKLDCEADWVSHPDFVVMMHGGRTFEVQIDGRTLKPGPHYTEVLGYDSAHPGMGPIFRVPVTVIVPQDDEFVEGDEWDEELKFVPGQIHRQFFTVPQGAQWADLVIETGDQEGERRLVLHALQRLPGRSYYSANVRRYLTLKPNGRQVQSFPVTGGRTLELTLAQYWSSLGDTEAEFELTFHGIVPANQDLFVDGAQAATRVDVLAPFRDEALSPAGSLNVWRQTIRPTDSETRPLSPERDSLPENRQIMELVLTYKFSIDGKEKVTPRFNSSEEFESNIWVLYDENKQRVATGSSGSSTSIDKGSYVLKFQIRHDSEGMLDKAKDMPLLLDHGLSKSLGLTVYASYDDALKGGRRFGSKGVAHGDRAFMYVTGPSSGWPKGASAGDLLLGDIYFGKADGSEDGEGKRPGGFDVSFRLPPAPEKKASPSTPAKKEEKSEEDKLQEEIRDLKLNKLGKLYADKNEKLFNSLATELLEADPDDQQPVLIHQLKRLDQDSNRKKHLGQVIKAADKVIASVDTEKLRLNYGVKVDSDDEEAVEERKEVDKQRDILADALYRKGRAIAYAETMIAERKEAEAKQPESKQTEVEAKPKKKGNELSDEEKERRREERKKKRAEAAAKAKGDEKGKASGDKPKKKPGEGKKKQDASKAEEKSEDKKSEELPLPEIGADDFDKNYKELEKWVDTTEPAYMLLHIRNERRQERYATALKDLHAHMGKSKPSTKLYDKKIKILDHLGWQDWVQYEKTWNILRYPKAYQPF